MVHQCGSEGKALKRKSVNTGFFFILHCADGRFGKRDVVLSDLLSHHTFQTWRDKRWYVLAFVLSFKAEKVQLKPNISPNIGTGADTYGTKCHQATFTLVLRSKVLPQIYIFNSNSTIVVPSPPKT